MSFGGPLFACGEVVPHLAVMVAGCSDFLDPAQPMAQLFDPASNTFWRNVKERAVAPLTAFGRNPVRWDCWQAQHVPAVSQWCVPYHAASLSVYTAPALVAVYVLLHAVLSPDSRFLLSHSGLCPIQTHLCLCIQHLPQNQHIPAVSQWYASRHDASLSVYTPPTSVAVCVAVCCTVT